MPPPELLYLVVAVIAAIGIGVPLIRRRVFIPGEVVMAAVADDQLSERQRAYFQQLDAKLQPLGYTPLLNFVATNLDGANLTRAYRSDHDAAILNASCLKSTAKGPLGKEESGQNFLEWVTKFEDGTTLLTNNTQLSTLFELMPHQVRQTFPGVADAGRLKARHDRRVEELRYRSPRLLMGSICWPNGSISIGAGSPFTPHVERCATTPPARSIGRPPG